MYTPPFTVTDEVLHLVSEISEHIHVGINVGINEQRVLDACVQKLRFPQSK